MEAEKVEALLIELAQEDGVYDSEYDGRMISLCLFCSANLEHGEDHSEDCLPVRARKLLGPKWVEIEEARKAKKEAEHAQWLASRSKIVASRVRVTCEFCKKTMNAGVNNLKHHQSKNIKCLKLQSIAKAKKLKEL